MGVTHARTHARAAAIFTGHYLTANRMSAIPTVLPLYRRTHRAAVTSVLHHRRNNKTLEQMSSGTGRTHLGM